MQAVRFVKEGEVQLVLSNEKQNSSEDRGTETRLFYENLLKIPNISSISDRPPATSQQKFEKSKSRQNVNPITKQTDREYRLYFKHAVQNDVQSLQHAIERGIEIDAKDFFGWTALQSAAAAGAFDAVKCLLQSGASTTHTVNGLTACELALKFGNKNIADLIRNRSCFSGVESVPSTAIGSEYCQVCQSFFSGVSHESSITHIANMKSRPNEAYHYEIPSRSTGYRMLKEGGWVEGSGLGANGEGRKYPVPTKLKRDRTGLGAESKLVKKITHFKPNDERAVLPIKRPKRRSMVKEIEDNICRKKKREEHIRNMLKTFRHNAINVALQSMKIEDKKDEVYQILDSSDSSELTADLISIIREKSNMEAPMCLLMSLLLGTISNGYYDSRYRVLLRHAAALLAIKWDDFEAEEENLTHYLTEKYVESEEAKIAKEKNSKMKKIRRYALIATAGGVGGILLGVTGGLAAPLVAAGAGFFGTGIFAGLATGAGSIVAGTVVGIGGAGLTGYKMKKRIGSVEEFTIEPLTDGRGLHCVLCVSGWIDEKDGEDAFKLQWKHLQASNEQYTLRYESKYLVELGKAMEYLMSFAVSYAIQHMLAETALVGLVTAIAWPLALLSTANVIDNPWSICVSRSAQVGEQLAEVLLSRAHGCRPITLVGFSLGARVIYHCLLAMSNRDDCYGIIEDAVMLGAPVSASASEWQNVSNVVGGRIINGYCRTDWLLRFLYRTMSLQFSIAGTGPVDYRENRKIVNFDLTHLVKGHLDYSKKLPEVLNAVGIKVSPRSEESQHDLQVYMAKQDAEMNEAESKHSNK